MLGEQIGKIKNKTIRVEYDIKEIDATDILTSLNILGKEGWELVYLDWMPRFAAWGSIRGVFKRVNREGNMDTTLEEQLVGPCWVCGEYHKRKTVGEYLYFNDLLVCTKHKGADKWYNGALELAAEKLDCMGLGGGVT